MFCSNCGNSIHEKSNNCPNCGASLSAANEDISKTFNKIFDQTAQVLPKELKIPPIVAAILSFIIVGLGQMINGQLVKGIIMLTLKILIAYATGGLIGFFANFIFGILAALDAFKCSKKLEEGIAIGKFSILLV